VAAECPPDAEPDGLAEDDEPADAWDASCWGVAEWSADFEEQPAATRHTASRPAVEAA
jgi:hypothetical protein